MSTSLRNILISSFLFLLIVIITLVLLPSGERSASSVAKINQVLPKHDFDANYIPSITKPKVKPIHDNSHERPKLGDNMVKYEDNDKQYDNENLAKLVIFKVNDKEKISLLAADPINVDWQKPFVILLHDAPSKAQEWDDIGTMRALVDAGYRVRALNLPGRGATTTFQTDIKDKGLWLKEVVDDFSLYPFILVMASTGSNYGTPFLHLLVETSFQHSVVTTIAVGPTLLPPVLKLAPTKTIFIYGENDPLYIRDKNIISGIPSVKIEIIEETGHKCWKDDPTAFNNVLVNSITSLNNE